MLIPDTVLIVPSGHKRDSKTLCGLKKLLVSTCNPDSVSGVENRAFCLSDLLDNRLREFLGHLRKLRFPLLTISGKILRSRMRRIALIDTSPSCATCLIILRIKADEILGLNKSTLNIQRNVKPGRTRTLRLRQIKSLLKTETDSHRINHHLRVLCHARDRLCDVEFLIPHRTNTDSRPARRRVVAHLSRQNQHRDRVEPSSDHSGDCIRSSRSRRHAEQTDFIVDSRIGFRCHRTRLLMMLIETGKSLLMSECIVQMHRASARHREHLIDSGIDNSLCDIV